MFKRIVKAFGRYQVGDLPDYPKATWDQIERSARAMDPKKNPGMGPGFKLEDYAVAISDGLALEQVQKAPPLSKKNQPGAHA